MLTFEGSCPKPELLGEIKDLFEPAGNFAEGVRRWLLEKQRRLVLCTGYDDDDKHTLVGLGFEDGQSEEFFAYLPSAALLSEFPTLQPLQEFLIPVTRCEIDSYDVDDGKFDRMLGFSAEKFYHDELCAPLLSFSQALRLGLSYALSDVGEATFEPLCQEDYEEHEIQDLFQPGTLGSLHLGYRSPTPVGGTLPGFGTYAYFRMTDA